MVKKGKAGKKKGDGVKLPAKMHVFDLENITHDELKKYVTCLEQELKQMRKDCATFYPNKEAYTEFFKMQRDKDFSHRKLLALENSKSFDESEKLREFPERQEQISKIKDRERSQLQQQRVLKAFVMHSAEAAENVGEEARLKKEIEDKEKTLEIGKFLCDIILRDLKESYQKTLQNLDAKHSGWLKEIASEYVQKYLTANQDFSSLKQRLLTSVWEVKVPTHPNHETESYIGEMKRMQDFFLEIGSNNSEVIKLLRTKLTDLHVEYKCIRFRLKEVLQQNQLLKVEEPATLQTASVPQLRSRGIPTNKRDKNVEKLIYRSEILAEKLKISKAELAHLKQQFIVAARRIYQKSEYHAYLTEELLRLALQSDSSQDSLKSDFKETKSALLDKSAFSKEQDRKGAKNLSVQSSDTLFVPPQYHEFWDVGVKLRKK